jgi:hypothetical protein
VSNLQFYGIFAGSGFIILILISFILKYWIVDYPDKTKHYWLIVKLFFMVCFVFAFLMVWLGLHVFVEEIIKITILK